ncbi:RNA polymerase sigma-70 factor (ECF subfamily) [Saccharothrix tamanrassetensis]|uniref:RNA polymerase sigma-70 factor (ECF subfamily) n=1 Tax=Saccharothrix tamanrassetensis TaxID=1051531 RepID=A0A841CNB5_9PSEU|nr:RNA polymerase sigma factor [Saccharothrix tamanrassetensis]MBB5957036.1 RNA polymerase sigma-70 factor (ECF subfamily) [Saccharothrix tamanrassetensis]
MRSDVAPEALARRLLDESALLTLYESTAARLHRYVARRIGTEDAHDVVSEAFLVLWDRRAGHEHEPDALRAWLFGVATNLLRRHVRTEERKLRAWSREHGGRLDVADIGDRAADLADAALLAGPLTGMLADLRSEERDVLLLTAWAELTPSEIAVALDIPVATVRTRLHRARARLRTRLAALHPTDHRGNDRG